MKYNRNQDSSFWKLARSFLHEYMPLVRNLSDKTVESYRISIKLYLSFINDEKDITNDKVTFNIFTKEYMKDYKFKNDCIKIVSKILFRRRF